MYDVLSVQRSRSDLSESNASCVMGFSISLLHAEEVYRVLAERLRESDLTVAKIVIASYF